MIWDVMEDERNTNAVEDASARAQGQMNGTAKMGKVHYEMKSEIARLVSKALWQYYIMQAIWCVCAFYYKSRRSNNAGQRAYGKAIIYECFY